MSKRTTILLDDDLYEKLVHESLRKYRTTKGISKVVNELLRGSLDARTNIVQLLSSRRIKHTSANEFEQFRRRLSRKLES